MIGSVFNMFVNSPPVDDDRETDELGDLIPDAPLYVVSVDFYMSGWGHASGKANIVVVPCDDEETVDRVVDYEKWRGDQVGIHTVTSVKRDPRHYYSVMKGWAFVSARWQEFQERKGRE